jgi:hypothetical protein
MAGANCWSVPLEELISFVDALKASKPLGPVGRAILLGNGFSIAQGGERFAYSNLLDKSDLPKDSPIRQTFAALSTSDFEAIIKALEDAATIARAYHYDGTATRFSADANAVRTALTDAIKAVHPGVQFDIPLHQREACANFLNNFDHIFTTNYDLLLYWVIVRAAIGFTDGFGAGDAVGPFRIFSEHASCNTYYLHGALHLFSDAAGNTLKLILSGTTIMRDIAARIQAGPERPLIISEGTSIQKLAKIRPIPYLNVAYEYLLNLQGSLFIFGSSISEVDSHIYDAICGSFYLHNIFVFVHKPAQTLDVIREKLAPYQARRKTLGWFYLDADEVNVWGAKDDAR